MDYRDEAPEIIRGFLTYHETIKGHSRKTVDEYYLDLRTFFRFIKIHRSLVPCDTELDEISISDIDLAFVKSVTVSEAYDYLSFLARDRVKNQRSHELDYGTKASTRARKVSTLRSFYKYLNVKAKLIDDNPLKDLDVPKIPATLPRYLTLEEAQALLRSVDGKNKERDYCILCIFLNCGLRISEIVALNLQDVRSDSLRVFGKGSKERKVYLNAKAKLAIKAYIAERNKSNADNNYLFISREKPYNRLTIGAVETMIRSLGSKAGIENVHPHRFRRTFATWGLKRGIPIEQVKQLLGHENIETTTIYAKSDDTEVKISHDKYLS